MPRTTNRHFEAVSGAELRNFGYPKVADAAALPALAAADVGTIYTTLDDSRNHQWNGAVWNIWQTSGVNTFENITGAYVLDVAEHVGAAAELTLTGDASLSFTGWAANTTDKQTVRVKVLQDGTGGHVFDWAATEGVWAEQPGTLSTVAGDAVVQFDVVTLDGGANISLEPVGVAYSMDCLYTQTATTDFDAAINAGDFVRLSHNFSVFGDVVLYDRMTGRKVLADIVLSDPTDQSSPVDIEFADAHPAGTFRAVSWGQALEGCDLTTSVDTWETYTIQAIGATTLNTIINWDGPADSLEIVWGDGTTTTPTANAVESHTYGAAYTGPVNIRYRLGVGITTIDTRNVNAWSVQGSTTDLPRTLDRLVISSTQSTLSGPASGLPPALTRLEASATSVAISGDPAGLPRTLERLQAASSDIAIVGDAAGLPPNLDFINIQLAPTNLTGDSANLPATLTTFFGAGSLSTFTGTAATLPAGLTAYEIPTTASLTGNASGLPAGLIILTLTNSAGSTLAGTWADLPTTLVFFTALGSSAAITGTTAQMGAALNRALFENSNSTVTGPAANLPAGLTQLRSGNNTATNISGDGADLPAGLTILTLESTSSTLTWSASVAGLAFNNRLSLSYGAAGTGLTADQVNRLLVDLDTAALTPIGGRSIDLGGPVNAGADATSGGLDGLAAVTSLQARGWTVVTN